MKRSIIIALALALALGAAAIAEVADNTKDVGITAPVEEKETAPIEEAEATDEAETPAEAPAEIAPADDASALNDALKALRDARQDAHADELKAELNEYVAAGKLTQDQADLILKYVQDRQADKQNDQRGNKGQCGGKQRVQMPGNGQQIPGNGQQPQMPDANSGATPRMPQMHGNHR